MGKLTYIRVSRSDGDPRFFRDVVDPSRGDFAGTVNGILHQLVAHARGLEVLQVERYTKGMHLGAWMPVNKFIL